MYMLKKSKNNSGFTIVETMIVLAIAGLILAIVLLAVPALQRASQNSNIKSDAEAIASAINNYESNNTGQIPTGVSIKAGSNQVVVTGSGSVNSQATVQASDTIQFQNSTSGYLAPTYSTASLMDVSPNHLVIDAGYQCSTTPSAQLTPSASSIAIFYPIVTGSGGGIGCLQA